MKKHVQFVIAFLMTVSAVFAHDKKISWNGVIVPDWMMNCVLIHSDQIYGENKPIGDFIGTPADGTKIKKLSVNGNNLHFEYYAGEKPDESVMDAIIDFTCAKMGSAGTAYISHIKVGSRITFEEKEVSCSGPSDEYKYGNCLGMLASLSKLMFVDEKRIAKENERAKELEEEKAKQEAKRKESVFESELANAVMDGYVGLGVNLSNFQTKVNPLTEKVAVVVKALDADMSKAGFQKGDSVVDVRGLRGGQMAFAADVHQGRFDYREINDLPENIVFVVQRKGKTLSISVPKYNQEQLNAFKEKFEQDWSNGVY